MSSVGRAVKKDVEKLVTTWITVSGFAGVAISKRYKFVLGIFYLSNLLLSYINRAVKSKKILMTITNEERSTA
jgi:hypothetical protein